MALEASHHLQFLRLDKLSQPLTVYLASRNEVLNLRRLATISSVTCSHGYDGGIGLEVLDVRRVSRHVG
jgi:hypothetical protein